MLTVNDIQRWDRLVEVCHGLESDRLTTWQARPLNRSVHASEMPALEHFTIA